MQYAACTSLTHQDATLITSVKAEPPPDTPQREVFHSLLPGSGSKVMLNSWMCKVCEVLLSFKCKGCDSRSSPPEHNSLQVRLLHLQLLSQVLSQLLRPVPWRTASKFKNSPLESWKKSLPIPRWSHGFWSKFCQSLNWTGTWGFTSSTSQCQHAAEMFLHHVR